MGHKTSMCPIKHFQFNLQVLVMKGLEEQWSRILSSVTWWRRRLVDGSGIEKMSWHIRTLPHCISSTFGQDCPYSH